jgi:adenine phosphoribosyltransferase
MTDFKSIIREIPDFPKPGILFYDLTTLMKNPAGFAAAIDQLAEPYRGKRIDLVLGIEARGFIFASSLAYKLGAGFVPVRKPGKLPAATHRASYDLEYGKDSLEMHQDAITPGSNVLIADDLIATGGTAAAVANLVQKMGGTLVGLAFLVELEFLHGRDKLQGMEVFSLIKY